MPAESVIERLRRLEARVASAPWTALKMEDGSARRYVESSSYEFGFGLPIDEANFIVLVRNALPRLLRVAEAADELYALRGRISPEEYFNSSEACRARTKLDLAVVDLRDMEAGGE